MIDDVKIDVIIPAYNEEQSIGHVLNDIPKTLVREVVVVNNNSSDNTAYTAKAGGAVVLTENKMGYGRACLKGMDYLKAKPEQPDIVVFLDADYSDHPEEMQLLLDPILKKEKDIVIGSRVKHKRESGSMTPQQVFGNWLATKMMKVIHKHRYTDLGPFRAISYDKLLALEMQDQTYGWTVEMQLKAIKKGLKIGEVEVSYRKRIGVSKVSGTVKGTILAGYKIITTILKYK